MEVTFPQAVSVVLGFFGGLAFAALVLIVLSFYLDREKP